MKVTLNLEETMSQDVSIMVDALRASTTITLALNNFKEVIPCFSIKEAFKLKKEKDGIIAGERKGEKIEGFDIGNSPHAIKDYESEKESLILTTSNGTRILKNMKSKVLIGSLINAESVGVKSVELANEHIDVVMAGVNEEFAIEDFLASGEILYWIYKNLDNCKLSEYAKSAILASRDYNCLKKSILHSRSGKRLIELGYENDVKLCSLKNITQNVPLYENNKLRLI